MNTPATPKGAEIQMEDGDTQAADAFLKKMFPKGIPDDESSPAAGKPENEDEGADPKDASNEEEPDNEDQGSDEEGSEGADDEGDKGPEKKFVEDEGLYVKVKVGDEVQEVPVKSLMRLHGQEAALTKRSQEVANQRKQAEAQQQQYAASLDMLAQRAVARANEYRQIDFMAMARDPNVPPEQLNALQVAAQEAMQEEAFFKTEINNVVTAHQQQNAELMAKQAQDTVRELGDPASPYHIEGWNQEHYSNLLKFATDVGLDPGIANALVDPAALKIIDMAMAYKRGSQAPTKVVNKTGKRIVKGKSSPVRNRSSSKDRRASDAMKKLQQTGSQDAAAEAFLARWEDEPTD